jgi:hypothetical protein
MIFCLKETKFDAEMKTVAHGLPSRPNVRKKRLGNFHTDPSLSIVRTKAAAVTAQAKGWQWRLFHRETPTNES